MSQRVRSAFGERTISRIELDGRGFLTVLGGFLLVLPGFLTDILGALLLLPPTRRADRCGVAPRGRPRWSARAVGPTWSIFRPTSGGAFPRSASRTSHRPGTD